MFSRPSLIVIKLKWLGYIDLGYYIVSSVMTDAVFRFTAPVFNRSSASSDSIPFLIIQVVPVVARILTEMFSGELSWSTDSIRLQISNPDLKDQTVEQFKELHRLLQNQQNQASWHQNIH